jgi:multidrug efflux pump subunit AcrB
MRALYEELDRQVTRLLEVIDRKAGPNGRLLALTADHGMPSEPPPGRRYFTGQIVDRLHARFDPAGTSLVTYYGDAANNQIFLDPARLEALKITPAQIAQWLETEDYLAAAFTEDEVRAAQRRLPAPRR